MSCLWRVCALALLSSTAAAEPVLVVQPQAEGDGAVALAAELGLAVDQALRGHRRFTRVGAQAPSASELATALGCLYLDPPCARQAASAAQASAALVSRLTRVGSIIRVELQRVSADPGRPAWEGRRRIDLRGAELDDALLRVLADYLARIMLSEYPGERPALVAPGGMASVELDGEPRTIAGVLEVGAGRHRIVAAGGGTTVVDLLPEEVAVLDLGARPLTRREGSSARRTAAWLSLAVGVGGMVGGGIMSAQLAGTQSDYDRARTGAALDTLAARGRDQALTTKVLYGTGAIALTTAIILFLE